MMGHVNFFETLNSLVFGKFFLRYVKFFLHVLIRSHTWLATALQFNVLGCEPNSKCRWKATCLYHLIPVRFNQSSRLDIKRFLTLTNRLICLITCLYITDVSSGPSISSPGLETFVDLRVGFVLPLVWYLYLFGCF